MAARGTGFLPFMGDLAADGSIRMNSEAYRTILSAHIQPNAAQLTRRRFLAQMENVPKHTAKETKQIFSEVARTLNE